VSVTRLQLLKAPYHTARRTEYGIVATNPEASQIIKTYEVSGVVRIFMWSNFHYATVSFFFPSHPLFYHHPPLLPIPQSHALYLCLCFYAYSLCEVYDKLLEICKWCEAITLLDTPVDWRKSEGVILNPKSYRTTQIPRMIGCMHYIYRGIWMLSCIIISPLSSRSPPPNINPFYPFSASLSFEVYG
jgi:hypothetical protein